MNRSELIAAVANRSGLTKKQAELAVVSIIGEIRDAMHRGERVSVKGLGVFSRRERAARNGTNPRTRESITIPARTVVHFAPAIELGDAD